ncbi:hypothetical protein NW759_008145 [Fusarium solani]|jgi:hypothetical protein|nr:hypothetical protein NW759_008145 [Fusarium solani]
MSHQETIITRSNGSLLRQYVGYQVTEDIDRKEIRGTLVKRVRSRLGLAFGTLAGVSSTYLALLEKKDNIRTQYAMVGSADSFPGSIPPRVPIVRMNKFNSVHNIFLDNDVAVFLTALCHGD